MKAIGYLNPLDSSDPKALENIEIDCPAPFGQDLLVRIEAISVNPVDTKIRRRGGLENGAHRILGWDAVGAVVEVGAEVTDFEKGDRVWYAGDLTRPGSNAEFQLVDQRIVGHAPKTMSAADAAALPLTSLTAWEMLFDRLQVPMKGTPGQEVKRRVLIVGGAGGVGSIAVQLANTLTAVELIATAGREESRQWLRSLGAQHIVSYREGLARAVREAGFQDVSDVLSLTATSQHFADLVDILAPQGRLGLIDDPEPPIDIRLMKQKSLSLHWEFMYTRSLFNTPDIRRQQYILNEVARLVDEGQIKSTRKEHFGTICAANLLKAHQQLERGDTIGKIVLEGFE